MKSDFLVDYLACNLVKVFGFIIRALPKNFSFFLGRRLGDLVYCFDPRHRAIAYSNIRKAFGSEVTPKQGLKIAKGFYQAFGQNLIELFLVPLIDQAYMKKYVSIEGLDNIFSGLKKGKAVILLTVHAGSWELSSIVCSNLGFPFAVFVRGEQRYPRLNKLLNFYRTAKGCRIINREAGARDLIEAINKNEAIALIADQGGKNGTQVKFFGQNTSMSTGAIKLALKYGTPILPVFYTRIKGPYIKIFVEPAIEIEETDNKESDVAKNLQKTVLVFEKYLRKYPQEYLWSYKIWKYSYEKNILLLSDGKTGHLRQSEAAAKIISGYLETSGVQSNINTVEVKFKHKFSRVALNLSSLLAGKYHCQGCLWCMRKFLAEDTFQALLKIRPDIIISCGASVAGVNFILSRETLAKSILIMRPDFLSLKNFDLVITPEHDRVSKRKNTVIIEGALNLIDEEYLKECASRLASRISKDDKRLAISDKQLFIGLLMGGDSKKFILSRGLISEVIKEIKSAAEKINANILVTTSRRTGKEIEELIKREFKDYPRCKLLVIANEKNIPEAVGGILGLSSIAVLSGESISMISEAVSSKKYILVFKSSGLSRKHNEFLRRFAENKYIYIIDSGKISRSIEDIQLKQPDINTLKDNLLVKEAIKRIL
ncbi:MAG: ELM1/GtrOC1 family putative glycosyltransferase [Candidatus Omnitrophica bacterium]|nr:ELM1/GtrOC1 family putative glycosyltransferase [Candidatus Omnitrophota bacterium]